MSERGNIDKGQKEKGGALLRGADSSSRDDRGERPASGDSTRTLFSHGGASRRDALFHPAPDRDGKHVRHGAAPSLPEAYVKAVDGAPIGPRNGSCGTAMYLRKPVVVKDVMTDPLWADYRELAEICGLSACWSTPIFRRKAMCWARSRCTARKSAARIREELRLTQIATHIAGIAIERQRAQEMLREREARINLAAESADLAFWVIYPEQNTAWMSDKGRSHLRIRFRAAVDSRLDLRARACR